MHIFAGFVPTASAVPPESLAEVLVPLPHPEASALAVVRQTAIQEAAPLPHRKSQEARRLTDRTVLLCFGHPWILVAPPPETCTAKTQWIHARSSHRMRVHGNLSPDADNSCTP